MLSRKHFLASLCVTLACWLILMWPLPRFLFSAIPGGSPKRIDRSLEQRMYPGDHLQLLYHFWLVSDMLTGDTPLFYNLYEFNAGNDKERYEPGAYYIPSSLLYALGAWIGGRAFGWNFASFVSLWMSCAFAYGLARRYTDNRRAAGVMSALPVLLPYRWISLCGGSPTGFAMMWVPAVLLGLDVAVREEKWRGAALAGVAILFAGLGDPQTFFFCCLAAPAWCLFAFFQRDAAAWRAPRTYGRIALRLLPFAAGALLAVAASKTTVGQIEAYGESGRPLDEVSHFSAQPCGLFAQEDRGVDNQIYLGFTPVILIAAGCAALLWSALRRRGGARNLVLLLLLAAATCAVAVLSSGPHGLWEGRLFRLARKVIPHYDMLRQPAKVYALMPFLLAVACAVALDALTRRGRPFVAGAVTAAAAAALIFEYRLQIMPVICLLDSKQEAYAEVARQASDAHAKPHAVVLPLWPGDSHFTSVYQHYASLYRIRMVNGYRPFFSKKFAAEVVERFSSVNQGFVTDEQLAALGAMGVTSIVLHEDLYPEKVSPFPVVLTIQRLLNHPRLRLLRQDGPVWAFEILQAPRVPPAAGSDWNHLFPARRFEAERLAGATPVEDAACGAGSFAALAPGQPPAATPAVETAFAPSLRWMIRVRGSGRLACAHRRGESVVPAAGTPVNAAAWTWVSVPVPAFEGCERIGLDLSAAEGAVDADMILLAAGPWTSPSVGDSLYLPAPSFFHAGNIDPEADTVCLRARRERSGVVFYGPKLPLEPGRYQVDVSFSSTAPAGALVGTWIVSYDGGRELAQLELRSGKSARAELDVEFNLPMLMALVYESIADADMRAVTITRIR